MRINNRRRFLSTVIGMIAYSAISSRTRGVADKLSNAPGAFDLELSGVSTFNDDDVASIGFRYAKWLDAAGEILISILNSVPSTSLARIYSVVLIGDLRLGNAASTLVENIGILDNRVGYALRPWSEYVAVDALTKIGVPALKAIIAGLSAESNEHNRALLLFSLGQILTYDGCVEACLQAAIKQESDPGKREKLSAALVAVSTKGEVNSKPQLSY